jgi:hypothetical protein
MVSVLTSSAVYRGFDPQSGQTKDNKHAALRSKELVLNQNNVSRVERQVYLQTVVSNGFFLGINLKYKYLL